MYLLSGKIRCKSCGKNYRGKKQRSVRVYVCSSYSKGESDCKRFVIKEKELLEVIEKHRKIVEKRSEVYMVEVYNGEDGYIIKYDDGTHESVVSKTHVRW